MNDLMVVERPTKDARLVFEVEQAVLDSCQSQHTRRAYARALSDFLAWCGQENRRLERATVQRHVASLREGGAGAASINQRLAAIKRYASEAADQGLIAQEVARGIEGVKGARAAGQRKGNWLSAEQATRLLKVPDASTTRGKRDRAILAVLAGCGLRRSEVAGLEWRHVQQREGRTCIVDLRGKGAKLRTVPVPRWVAGALEAWREVAATGGPVFRQVDRYGHVAARGISPQTVRAVVVEAGRVIGVPTLAPHDLRRTFAKLAIRGGAQWDQLQMSLGHASISTTQRYVGMEQDLADAPGDRLGIVL